MQREVLRIKDRAQFQAVMSGQTVARTAHFALHRVALDAVVPTTSPGPEAALPLQALFVLQGTWVGAMVPKRWAKRAVTRNAIKRQIYAVSANCASQLPVAAHVVRLRTGFARDQFHSASSDALKAAVRAELIQLFDKVLST